MTIFRSAAIALLLAVGGVPSALADCGNDSSRIARLICGSDDLRSLDQDVSLAYDAARSLVAEADHPFLEAEQKAWQVRRPIICSMAAQPGSTDEDRQKCLQGSGASRLERLKDWGNFGVTQILIDSPTNRAACSVALERENFRWSRHWMDFDNFDPLVPVGATEPTWSSVGENPYVRLAHFDILNEGKSRDVYAIDSDPEARYRFHWLVVVADGEEALLREQVTALSADLVDGLRAFGTQLRTDEIEGPNSGQFTDIFGPQRKAATLRSMIITASNTGIYRYSAPQSRAVEIAGKTYLLASDSRGTLALLEPVPTGSLMTLCRNNAIPSREEIAIEVVDSRFPCPTGNEEQDIVWEGDQWDMHTTIDLEEWGGPRVVQRRLESAGMMYANTHIYVGAVDEPSVSTETTWQPLQAVAENHDSSDFLFVEMQPYVVITDWIPLRSDASPLGVRYYRIIDDGLTAVCNVTHQRISPPGYTLKN